VTLQITALNIYPIKGCRGVPVTSAAVDQLGLVDDRRLMLVDAEGRFISQREIAALATLVPAVIPAKAGTSMGTLLVIAPNSDPFESVVDPDGPSRAVSVWGSEGIIAADQGDDAAHWFSNATGTPCRLVAWGSKARNPIDPEYSPRVEAETAFTDGYPIMAALQESLDDLNKRLAEPVPMQRFRPSVVIGGGRAWSEDDWMAMMLGEIDCDAVKPCARCVVTTTDQVTGTRSERQEPLRTLATFRTIPRLGAIFGQNLVPRNTGVLRVGDAVELM
jgi:uncharacterized protein YcbX